MLEILQEFRVSDFYTLSLGLFITGCLMYIVRCIYLKKGGCEYGSKERS